MKTVVFTILLFACHTQLFAQLQVPENDAKEKRNSLTIDYNVDTGIGVRYERELIKKKKYALVGQVGISGNMFIRRSDFIGGYANFNASLSHRFSFGEHSLEAGVGVLTGNNFYTGTVSESPVLNEWITTPYLNLGYMYQPKGKNWFLRANLQLAKGRYTPIRRNLSVGFGIKF